jgi:hypothetical protein
MPVWADSSRAESSLFELFADIAMAGASVDGVTAAAFSPCRNCVRIAFIPTEVVAS